VLQSRMVKSGWGINHLQGNRPANGRSPQGQAESRTVTGTLSQFGSTQGSLDQRYQKNRSLEQGWIRKTSPGFSTGEGETGRMTNLAHKVLDNELHRDVMRHQKKKLISS
jgi:hypothetical protein